MIVDFETALEAFNKIENSKKSFYYNPIFVELNTLISQELKPIYFVKEVGNQVFFHSALIGEVGYENYMDLQTPYGYGGPIIIGDLDFRNYAISEYIKCCRDNKIIVEFIRFHPVICNDISYYGHVLQNRDTVLIDLEKEDLFNSFSSRIKTAIKVANKNSIQVTSSKEPYYIDEFYNIYIGLMEEKQTSEEYFFPKKMIVELLKDNNVYLYSAKNPEGEVLGASIFVMSGNLAEYHLSATTPIGRKNNVSHLLLYEFALFAKTLGIQSLYLGGGTSSDPENSLLFFKKGFSKITRPYNIGYYIFDDTYETYKSIFMKNNKGLMNNRILFYR